MSGPLLGIRVLDLTQGVAGPYATKLLSDYGADVIKIERPGGGDPTRRVGPFPGDRPHPDRSGLFFELNSGKRSVTLNLATATGRRMLQRLTANVDLVIESFRPGTLALLGLDAERLEAIQPAATLVQLSNFGQDGPYRDFELDDLGAYAMGGVLSLTGAEGREPARIGLYAPLFLAGGVLATYHHRRRLRLAPHRPRRARGRLADGDPRQLDGPGRPEPRRLAVHGRPHVDARGEPVPHRDAERRLPLQ